MRSQGKMRSMSAKEMGLGQYLTPQSKWTAEVNYQSAERKTRTGYSTICGGEENYIGTVLNEHAALVAAAPELLEALRALQQEIKSAMKFDVKKHYSLMVADVAASKAIAKAEGRQ